MKAYVVRLLSRNEPEAVFEHNLEGYQSAIKLARLLAEETIDHVLVYELELEEGET